MSGEVFETDCVVIGAGVVGLAIAAQLAQSGREVLVLERNARPGEETSARNSEVIHAGLYYAPGSLKAAFCARGRDLLYQWCEARGVAHRRTGKLVTAASAEEATTLERIAERARDAGAPVELLDARAARALEPALAAAAALHSPLTGIVDSHGLMVSLIAELEAGGGGVAARAPVLGGARIAGGVELRIGGAEPMRLRARHVVNAAGLWAQSVAATIDGAEPPPPARFAKGVYFALTGARAPFTRLIYPAPIAGGLGVHLAFDLGGRARFGPDVEFLDTTDPDRLDYAVDPARADAFYAVIRRYWPGLPDGALQPDYAGVRPQIAGGARSDFVIRTECDGALTQLYGFESPALTSCLAIAERVQALIGSGGEAAIGADQ